MTSLPAFIKVGKTPATQNLVLEQYAVKIGNSTLFLYDKILIYHEYANLESTEISKKNTEIIYGKYQRKFGNSWALII
jgi:hypothetical protein